MIYMYTFINLCNKLVRIFHQSEIKNFQSQDNIKVIIIYKVRAIYKVKAIHKSRSFSSFQMYITVKVKIKVNVMFKVSYVASHMFYIKIQQNSIMKSIILLYITKVSLLFIHVCNTALKIEFTCLY